MKHRHPTLTPINCLKPSNNAVRVPPAVRFKNPALFPHTVCRCAVVWCSQQTAIISLNSINCFNLVTFVVCEVWTDVLYAVSVFKMTVNRWPVTAAAGVQSRASPCEICGCHRGTGIFFSCIIWFRSYYQCASGQCWSLYSRFCYQEDNWEHSHKTLLCRGLEYCKDKYVGRVA